METGVYQESIWKNKASKILVNLLMPNLVVLFISLFFSSYLGI